MVDDYSEITEVPGALASQDQFLRLRHRYQVAAGFCSGKRVLEVACGAGIGLGYLAQTASFVLGGDYTRSLVSSAQRHYRDRLDVVQLDGHALPFEDAVFDTIVLFEAIYYFEHPARLIQECHRVLENDGKLVLCSVNKQWPGFNPSPYNTGYLSASELFLLLTSNGFKTEMFGAFSTANDSMRDKVVSLIKRAAVGLSLIPGSMKGKVWLKRIFFGKLVPLPADLIGTSVANDRLVPISPDESPNSYKVLFAIGRRG